jgi:tetratricopeptide (TPR) repeat protein
MEARGANKALDIKTAVTSEGRTRVAVLLQKKPRYDLSWGGGNRVSLTLYETRGEPEFVKGLSKEDKTIRIEEEKPESGLKLTILLKSSPREVECSWIEKEHFLLIDVAQARDTDGKMVDKKNSRSLKALRFGPQQGFTRMIADLSARPAWGMSRRDDRHILFDLSATSTAVDRSSYGPMKRLRSVTLHTREKDLQIKAEPESTLQRIKVFWLKQGGRWVVDYYDEPPEIMDAALRFDTRVEPEPEKSPPPVRVERREEGGPASAIAGTQANDVQPAPEGSPGSRTSAVSGQGSVVRMKIEKADPAQPEPPGKEPKTTSFKLEPKVRYDVPVVLPEGQRVFNLRPAEAFLYGRVREALEVKDYEKGVALIDEFLSGFPDSILTEDMAFLAGDCRFALLEKGEKALHSKVLATYQEAVSRYPRSEYVQGALVKMARAHDLAGNDHDAIGLLTMAINQYGHGDRVVEALVARGRVYLRMNQPQRAIEDFKTVITRFPASSLVQEARYGIAGYFHGAGMYDDAERMLKEIANSAPDFFQEHPEFLFLRARNNFYRKDYGLAREQYFRALNLGHQPESSDLLISHIGDTYFHQSMEQEAEVLYRMAVDYFPESEGAGIAKLRIADQSSGVTAYEEVYQKNLNKPIGDLALLEMAGKFYKKGQYALAVETLRKLTGKPVQSDVQREARQLFFRCAEKEIKAYHDGGQYEKVIEYFQTADPPLSGNIEPEVTMLVGDSFYRRQRYPEAVRVFSQITARELPPGSRGRFVVDFAKTYLSQGDEENARILLESAAGEKLAPADQQKAGLLLGELYRKRGELKKASEIYQSILVEKRLLSDREMAGLYLGLGTISNRQNLYEKARDALNRSIALSEKDRESRGLLRDAYLEMGNSYHLEGRHQEAIRHYGNCLDLDYGPEMKGYWDVKYKLALSHLGTGESQMAERIMNEIMEEGDPALQQKVQMKMGTIALERELKRLPIGKGGESTL